MSHEAIDRTYLDDAIALQSRPSPRDQMLCHPPFSLGWLEQVLLLLADAFDVRIVWDRETALVSGALAAAGALFGGFAGGRVGAALGAGVGGVAGLGISTLVTLREIWSAVKDKLQELVFMVWNELRRLDAVDGARALELLLASAGSRQQLLRALLDFIAFKLGREVVSRLAVA